MAWRGPVADDRVVQRRDVRRDPDVEEDEVVIMRGGREIFKMREKEAYAIVIMESLISLSREASHGGFGEFYEAALDNLLADVPTKEFVNPKYKPHDALIRYCKYARKKLDLMGFSDIAKVPDGQTPSEEDGTVHTLNYFELLLWIEQFYSSEWSLGRANPKLGVLNHFRTILKNRMAIDMIDDMGMLRHKMPVSEQEEEEYDYYFGKYEKERGNEKLDSVPATEARNEY